jgi:phage tail protein X
MADLGMTRYRTKDGDVLDLICQNQYGNVDAALGAVLAANPGFYSNESVLPAGILILMPDLVVSEVNTVRLWD